MNSSVSISDFSLVLALVLVFVAVAISYKEKLGLGWDIILSIVRTVVQLVIVGYVLKYLFKLDNFFLTLLMCLFVITTASLQANKRNPSRNKKLWQSFLAILISTVVTGGLLIASGAIKFIPSQMIPIAGMIASNTMVAVGLSYKQLATQFEDQRQQVLEKLALGASAKQAAASILRTSIKMGIQPTIDLTKTVGLVSLPGVMSGLIFAGVDPVLAIKYQIMIMFMLLSATALGSVIASYFAYKTYFNEHVQLLF